MHTRLSENSYNSAVTESKLLKPFVSRVLPGPSGVVHSAPSYPLARFGEGTLGWGRYAKGKEGIKGKKGGKG